MRARLLPAHLLALICVSAAATLGFWQLDAWQQRRSAEARDLSGAVAEPLADVYGADDLFPGDRVGQPVVVRGTWLPESTVFVTGREQDGRDGVWAVSVVRLDGADAAVPVVRGWALDVADVPGPPTGAVTLEGYLQPSEGRPITDDDPTDDRLPQLRTADLVQRVPLDLFAGYVVARTAEPGLAVADPGQLPAVSRFTALRNLLYAVEWWVFGAFAAFVWWRHVRDVRAAADSTAAGSVGSPP